MALVCRPTGYAPQNASAPVEGLTNALAQAHAARKQQKLKNFDKALGEYYTSNSLYDGGLSIADGELKFTGTSTLPTSGEAWLDYKALLEEHGQDAGFTAKQKFDQIYAGMVKEYGTALKNDITKFTNAGYSTRAVRNALSASDVYLSNANTLIGDKFHGGEYAGILSEYMPRKSMLAQVEDSPGTTGLGVAGAGALGYGLYTYGSGIDEDVLEAGKGKYKTSLESARKTLTTETADAKKIIDDVKSSKEYKKLDGRTKAAKEMVKDATKKSDDLIAEAKSKFQKSRGSLKIDAPTRGANVMKYLSKTPNIMKGISYAAVPSMIEGAMTEITDDSDIGRISGESANVAMTTAQAIQSGAQLKPAITAITAAFKKHGTAKVLREVMKKGGMGLAGRTLAKAGAGTIGGAFTGGMMTALMAAWSVKDLYDIAMIIADM